MSLALVLCSTGSRVFSQNLVFSSAFSKLRAKIELINRSGAQKSETEFEKGLERKHHDSQMSSMASYEQTKAFNTLVQLANLTSPLNYLDKSLADVLRVSDVTPFHLQYVKTKCLPYKCDPDACYRVLEEGYELAKSFRLHKFSLTSGAVDSSEYYTQKRWGSLALIASHKSWISTAKPGDIYYSKRIGYVPSILQSFSNSVYKPGTVKSGMTQVSIGFVDLSSLVYNTLSLKGGASSFKWYGYDMSPYSVAKALVLVNMMREATPKAVLQVWYSSAWTRKTENLFLASVSNILDSGVCQDTDVLFFLSHWFVSKATLKMSRDMWLSVSTDSAMFIANFKREIDRNALISYRLTGQVLDAEVGSIVMCCNPSGLGDLALNLEFLQTIYYPTLAEKWSNSRSSILEVGTAIALSRISTWMQHLKNGNVEVEVRRKKVENNMSILHEISSLKPSLVSWSNVPDYMHPENFFELVRAISSEHTIHQLYSMNWIQNCFGTGAADYPKEKRADIIKKAEEDIKKTGIAFKTRSLLTDEVFDNAYNTSMSILCKNLHQTWAESFLAYGRVSKHNLKAECQEYNQFHRAPGTVFLEFSL